MRTALGIGKGILKVLFVGIVAVGAWNNKKVQRDQIFVRKSCAEACAL